MTLENSDFATNKEIGVLLYNSTFGAISYRVNNKNFGPVGKRGWRTVNQSTKLLGRIRCTPYGFSGIALRVLVR